MESHRCKLCSRRFLNGRALGGHMKAHLSFLPPCPIPTTTTLSSAALRENPRKSIKFSDPESEDESRDRGGSPSRRRKRRSRRIHSGGVDSPEAEPVSSVSDTSPEEDVAMCLMMLCRDDGWRNHAKKVEENGADSATEAQRKLHQCEVCKKFFRSSQALGGHRIIHRKKVVVVGTEEEEIISTSNKHKSFGSNRDYDYNNNNNNGGGCGDERRKIFECPFCGKVFGSGQALGGHKRSHMMGVGSSSLAVGGGGGGGGEKITSKSNADNTSNNNSCIDLNLPAPTEDEDVHSVVSDDGGLTD